MGLTKEGVLRLRAEGFDRAEQQARELGNQIERATASARELSQATANAGRITTASLAVAKDESVALRLGLVGVETESRRVGVAAHAAARAFSGTALAARNAMTGIGAAAAATEGAFARAGAAAAAAGRQTQTGLAPAAPLASSLVSKISGITVAAFAAQAAMSGIAAALGRGEGAAAVGDSFARLAGGADQARVTLGALRQATGSSVSDSELMIGANRILAAQLNLSSDQMSQVSQAAVTLGRSLGLTATDSYQRLTLAIAKQEPELLDEIGIKVDLTKAIQAEAAARGVTVASLDAQTRTQVFANAVLEQARVRSEALSGSLAAGTRPVEQLGAKWENLKDSFALMITQNPVLIASLQRIGESAIRLAEALLPVVNAVATVVSFAGAAVATVAAAPVDLLGGFGGGAPSAIPATPVAAPVAARGPSVRQFESALAQRDAEIIGAIKGQQTALARRLSMQAM